MQHLQPSHSIVTSTSPSTSTDLIQKCALYDRCGKKGLFGQELPCPDDSLPREVSLVTSFYLSCRTYIFSLTI